MQHRVPLPTVAEELEQIMTGIFMQPNEQGIWQAYRWLMDLMVPVRVVHVSRSQGTQQVRLFFSEYVSNVSKENIKITLDSQEVEYQVLQNSRFD